MKLAPIVFFTIVLWVIFIPGENTVGTGIYNTSDVPVILQNNKSAVNPTLSQALEFVYSDHTDRLEYNKTFQCADFALAFHNNAEKSGLKCGYVLLNFPGKTTGHALNVFKLTDDGKGFTTTDGLLFIDCTLEDCYVLPVEWEPYQAFSLKPYFKDHFNSKIALNQYTFESLGDVCNLKIIW